MAKSLVDGSDADKPKSDSAPDHVPTFADLAQMSAENEAAEKTAAGGDAPAVDVGAASGEPSDKGVDVEPMKPRTDAQLVSDVLSILASRVDPMNLDQIRDIINEGCVGIRLQVPTGPIQAALSTLASTRKVVMTKKVNTYHYELTSQTRDELENPVIIRAQREAVVYLLAKRLTFRDVGHGAPMLTGALTATTIAQGLILGSTRGPEADAARAKGDLPTLPGESAYAIRQNLANDPEEDETEMTERVLPHLTRLIDATMGEEIPAATASGKVRFQLTQAGEALLFEAGLAAVVDTTFPPKAPRPTLEELTREAEAAAANQIKAATANAEVMKKHFEQEHARAEAEKVMRLGYEAWFIDHKIEEPQAILRRKSKSIKDRKIDTFEEEVKLNQAEHERVIDEQASMAAYLQMSQSEWAAAKSAQKAKEELLTSKLEGLMEVIRKKGNGVYLVSKQAYREVTNGEILVFSAEPHELGRLIGREVLPGGTQITMPGTTGAQWTPSASTGVLPDAVKFAADTMLAGLSGDASTPAAKEAIDKFIGDMAAKGFKVTAGPNDKGVPTFTCSTIEPSLTPAQDEPKAPPGPLLAADVDPSIKSLRGPLEAFLLENPTGVTSSTIEERFFDRLGHGKPKPAVTAMFVKVLAASVKAKVVITGDDGGRGQIYWHKDFGDPRPASRPVKEAKLNDKPAKPPGKGKKPKGDAEKS